MDNKLKNSNKVCKELMIKVLINPPYDISYFRFVMTSEDTIRCTCSECKEGITVIFIAWHENAAIEAFIINKEKAKHLHDRYML